jgi:3-hydroxyacyl-[acyl-carrier-protein] dehydratase
MKDVIDINGIKKVLPHRYPFLLIDRIIDFVPDISAHAIKCVTINEPFFEGHFPGRPLMPGVLVVESIVQTACFTVAMKMKEEMNNPGVSFMTIDKCKFRKPIIPGDVLNLKVKRLNKVKNVYKFEGYCLVNNVISAQCIFSAMIHDVSNTSK